LSRRRAGGRARPAQDHHSVYLRFAALLALLGVVWSRRGVVELFNQLDPAVTLAIWYAVFLVFVFLVFGGVSFMGRRFDAGDTAIVGLLTFAFMLVFNQVESPYAAIASGRNPEEVPALLYATEDGVVFRLYMWVSRWLSFPAVCVPLTQLCLWSQPADFARDMTYVATPVMIVVAAGMLFGARRAGRHVARVV